MKLAAAVAILPAILVAAPQPARADAFVAASAGEARWGDVCANATSCDRGDAAWTLRGGWRFSPWLGVEARWFDLGRAAHERGGIAITAPVAAEGFATARYEARGAGANVILSWPLAERMALSGIAGVARIERRDRFGGYTVPATNVEIGGVGGTWRATRAYYGLAASWDVSRAVALSLEATRYRGALREDIDMLAAGVAFRFR